MVISEQLVSIVFRVINTFVVALVAIYVFRKYALVRIKAVMHKKEQEELGLRLQGTQIALDVKKFEQRIRKEDDDALRMQQQIMAWRDRADNAYRVRMQQYAVLSQKALDRQAIKYEYIRSVYMRNQVVPQAIDKAREQLINHFQSPDAGQQYLKAVVARMQAGEQ